MTIKPIIASIALTALFVALLLSSCDQPPTSSQIERDQQEQLSMQAVRSVGMPAITQFQEKRMLKNILELRDQQIRTYTYTQDLNAKLHKLCDSVGYGIPYATQYTNPQAVQATGNSSHLYEVLPQADPSGLFSPPAAEGTWILCLDPTSKDNKPVYVEPRIVVSPFPLIPE